MVLVALLYRGVAGTVTPLCWSMTVVVDTEVASRARAKVTVGFTEGSTPRLSSAGEVVVAQPGARQLAGLPYDTVPPASRSGRPSPFTSATTPPSPGMARTAP